MKDYKRKDKLLITVISLACLIMVIANPLNFDIRDLAWDFALGLLFGSALLWILSEVGDTVSSFVFEADINYFKRKEDTPRLDGLNREQLIAIAGESVDNIADLDMMTDEDIARLIMSNNGVTIQTKKQTVWGLVMKAYKAVYFMYVSVVIFYYKAQLAAADLKKKKKKKKKHRKLSLQDYIEKRDAIVKEFSDARS